MKLVDPDGRKIEPEITKGGGKDGRDLYTIKITGKIINFSNNDVNMDKALVDIKSMMESSYQGENINGVDINLVFDFSIAETMKDVDPSDHLIVLAEPLKGKEKIYTKLNISGASNRQGGMVATVDADYFTGLYDLYIGDEGERTVSHEMGHLMGLEHTSKRSNLMSQGRAEFRGNNINKRQLGLIKRYLDKGILNRGSNTGRFGLPNIGAAIVGFKLTNTKNRRK